MNHRHAQQVNALLAAAEQAFSARQPAEAQALLREVAELSPDDLRVLHLQGITADALGDRNAAREFFAQACALDPSEARGWHNLATAERKLLHLPAARAAGLRALELAPVQAEILAEVAGIEMLLGNHVTAGELFERAYEAQPDNAAVAYDYGLWKLANREWRAGWALYERGLQLPERAVARLDVPVWQGEDLRDATLLLLGEQGIGDEVMFAGLIRDLLDATAPGQCVLECDERLHPAFQRAFPQVQMSARPLTTFTPLTTTAKQHLYQLALGSLGRVYRQQLDDFPRRWSYLSADPVRVAEIHATLVQSGNGPRIGVSFMGGGDEQTRNARSLPPRLFAALFADKSRAAVNLQYRVPAAMVNRHLGEDVNVEDVGIDLTEDIDGVLAVIASVDAVVTVDNSVAHFAGALGVPVVVILPPGADWRWGFDGESTPWYPSMRLVRRQHSEAPEATMARAGEALHALGF